MAGKGEEEREGVWREGTTKMRKVNGGEQPFFGERRERKGGMRKDVEKREENRLRPIWRSPIRDFQFFFFRIGVKYPLCLSFKG